MRLKNRGMGLVSAMVAAAIVAGLGLYVAKISSTSVQVSKTAKNSLDINSTFNVVSNALLKKDVCTSVLGGHILNYEPLQIASNGSILLQKDLPISGTSYTTKKIKFIQDPGNGQYYLKADFIKSDDHSFGATEISRKFPVSVTFDTSTSQVIKCHSDESNAIDNAVSEVVDSLPLCVFQEEACNGFHSVTNNNPLEVPIFEKYTICTQTYKREFITCGTKYFTRTCEVNGWNGDCSTGQVGCYTRRQKPCVNKLRLTNNIKTLNKCCRPGVIVPASNNGGNSDTNSGFAKWTCSHIASSNTYEWEDSGLCQTVSPNCVGGVSNVGDQKCCINEPTGSCEP